MLSLLPWIRGVFLTDSTILQRTEEWYDSSRQWIMDTLDTNTLTIGFIAVTALLLVLILVQAFSYRSKRKRWMAKEPLLNGAIDGSNDLILMVSPEGDIRYANPSAEGVLGIQKKEPGNLLDIVARTADIKKENITHLWESAVSQMYHKPQPHDLDQDFPLGGKLYQGRITPVMEKKHDTIRSLIVFFSPVRESSAQDTQAPPSDPATGLLNYAGFMAELHSRLNLAKEGTESFCCSVLHVENLDMLTQENGFSLRNELIEELARRITASLPEEWAVGRVADDRFALASPLKNTRDACAATVETVSRHLGQHLIWETQYVQPLIRVGIANNNIADTAQALLNAALAESAGLAAACLDTVPVMPPEPDSLDIQPPEDQPESEPLAIDTEPPVEQPEPIDIDTPPANQPEPPAEDTAVPAAATAPAVETQTVTLYYQPQVYLKDGYLRGFHVNAVYETTFNGRLEGDALYARIESKGLTIPFMKALLVKALKAARQWHALYAKRLIVTCTIPPSWLSEPELTDIVREALTESTLAADYLEFFIPYTKQRPWSSGDSEAIGDLKELGVRIAASGLSSGALPLDTAVSPPYNTLVMGRSLLVHAGESEKFRTLVGNIVQLGRKAGKDILATGIDGHNDLKMLRQKECPYGQGMIIGGPIPEEDLAQILIDGIDLPS